jgi:hypothetical protein
MNTIRRGLERIVKAEVSLRTAVVMAVCASVLLLGLMVIWLGMSTRSALLDKQLEDLDATRTALTDQINQTWTEIGAVTSPQQMEPRARQMGFAPAAEIEYLVVTPDVTTVTASIATTTTTMTTTTALTPTTSTTGTLTETVTITP